MCHIPPSHGPEGAVCATFLPLPTVLRVLYVLHSLPSHGPERHCLRRVLSLPKVLRGTVCAEVSLLFRRVPGDFYAPHVSHIIHTGRHVHSVVHIPYTHREAYLRGTPPTNTLREAYKEVHPGIYTPSGRHIRRYTLVYTLFREAYMGD